MPAGTRRRKELKDFRPEITAAIQRMEKDVNKIDQIMSKTGESTVRFSTAAFGAAKKTDTTASSKRTVQHLHATSYRKPVRQLHAALSRRAVGLPKGEKVPLWEFEVHKGLYGMRGRQHVETDMHRHFSKGDAAALQGKYSKAAEHYERARVKAAEAGSRHMEGAALMAVVSLPSTQKGGSSSTRSSSASSTSSSRCSSTSSSQEEIDEELSEEVKAMIRRDERRSWLNL